jgi:DNA-binding transcriptional MocR family regulator
MRSLATRWINDGTANQILNAIRNETIARQQMVAEILSHAPMRTKSEALHLWLERPRGYPREALVEHLLRNGLSIAAEDLFSVGNDAEEGVRVCLGAAKNRESLKNALEVLAAAMMRDDRELAPYIV